jgi:hypothetical protein
VIVDSLVIIDSRWSIENLVNPVGCGVKPQCVSALNQKPTITNQERINDHQSQIGQ